MYGLYCMGTFKGHKNNRSTTPPRLTTIPDSQTVNCYQARATDYEGPIRKGACFSRLTEGNRQCSFILSCCPVAQQTLFFSQGRFPVTALQATTGATPVTHIAAIACQIRVWGIANVPWKPSFFTFFSLSPQFPCSPVCSFPYIWLLN
jgi:hypothetical protein